MTTTSVPMYPLSDAVLEVIELGLPLDEQSRLLAIGMTAAAKAFHEAIAKERT